MEPVKRVIKAARERLGLTLDDTATQSGLSWNEYFDVELHGDEAFTVVHLRHLKKLCEVLQLGLLNLFGIECAFCGRHEQAAAVPPVPRDKLIRTRREAFGLTQDQVGDLIGFETVAIVDMEKDPDFLERWSVELIVELAGYLELPVQVLLGVRCSKCGR
jgi:transcriptional regulator with XRE-family HTH domain